MGSSLLATWSKKTSYHFTVIDPIKYKKLNNKFNKRISAFDNINKIKNFKNFDIIIFAVKPQIAFTVLKQFTLLKYKKNVLFITIIAGKKISFYNNYLSKNTQIVRVMPNLPASIEVGMSCLFYNKVTSRQNKNRAVSLFNKVGKVLIINNENDIDKVTAISGSGPGYFFLFIHMLEEAASKLGFNSKISQELVFQTALGSILLLVKSNKKSQQLEKIIAIKGGTTEAAINQFNKNKLKKIVNNAVKAAYNRAKEIGKNK